MARAIWSGVLTFGLVSVPVELYSATEAHSPVTEHWVTVQRAPRLFPI